MVQKLVTADDLVQMSGEDRRELLCGELVRTPFAGAEHGFVSARLARIVGEFVYSCDLGELLAAGTGFKVDSNPDTVLAPDFSFIRKGRIKGKLPKNFFPGAPDLAVEVVSPDDTKREVAEKVNMWLAHGTTSCWVADPATMTITIHRTSQEPIRLTMNDRIENDPVLPGFIMDVSKVFTRA